jgi:hypothetical protein
MKAEKGVKPEPSAPRNTKRSRPVSAELSTPKRPNTTTRRQARAQTAPRVEEDAGEGSEEFLALEEMLEGADEVGDDEFQLP